MNDQYSPRQPHIQMMLAAVMQWMQISGRSNIVINDDNRNQTMEINLTNNNDKYEPEDYEQKEIEWPSTDEDHEGWANAMEALASVGAGSAEPNQDLTDSTDTDESHNSRIVISVDSIVTNLIHVTCWDDVILKEIADNADLWGSVNWHGQNKLSIVIPLDWDVHKVISQLLQLASLPRIEKQVGEYLDDFLYDYMSAKWYVLDQESSDELTWKKDDHESFVEVVCPSEQTWLLMGEIVLSVQEAHANRCDFQSFSLLSQSNGSLGYTYMLKLSNETLEPMLNALAFIANSEMGILGHENKLGYS